MACLLSGLLRGPVYAKSRESGIDVAEMRATLPLCLCQNARKNVSKNNLNYGDILLRTYHANDRRSVVKKLQSVTVKGLLVCAGEDL